MTGGLAPLEFARLGPARLGWIGNNSAGLGVARLGWVRVDFAGLSWNELG